jgi:hypothetical protein
MIDATLRGWPIIQDKSCPETQDQHIQGKAWRDLLVVSGTKSTKSKRRQPTKGKCACHSLVSPVTNKTQRRRVVGPSDLEPTEANVTQLA